MIDDSLLFTQQVLGAPWLDAAQVDEFLSRIPLSVYSDVDEDLEPDDKFTETLDQVQGWFRSLTGASQRLLVRGHSAGFLPDEFVDNEVRRFDESVLELEWLGVGRYASVREAYEFYDARLSSVLLVWEQLGSSLEPLGLTVMNLRQRVEWALNGYKGFKSAADLRLTTRSEVERLAELVTYCAVDARVEKDLGLGFDDREAMVVLDHEVFPLANKESGQNATYAKVVHEELERLLRGRSIDDYLMANRFVREREIGASLGEARLVLEHLDLESRPMADGFL